MLIADGGRGEDHSSAETQPTWEQLKAQPSKRGLEGKSDGDRKKVFPI